MALPVTFGPETAAAMAQLDQNFQAVGAQTTILCSATGTNSIALTPVANQSAANGYGLPNPLKFGFTAPAASTGAVTAEVGALGFLPVYVPTGSQATSGTLQSGQYYEITYVVGASYNAGAGAWVLSSYQPAAGVTAVAAAKIAGLGIKNNAGTPSTKIDMSFTQACLVSAVGAPIFTTGGSFTIDLTTGTVTSAANGMDGESRPASGWVYLYVISTGTGSAGLGSTTSPLSGAPTLPAGYSYSAYAGAMYCDGSSNLLRSKQLGNTADYNPTTTTNTLVPPSMATGSASTWTAIAVAGFVPTTASKIKAIMAGTNFIAGQYIHLAPSNGYPGGTGVASDPANYYINATGGGSINQIADMVLQSTNIYYGSNAGSAASISCLGWADYCSAAG